ncbi:MAG: hypothetical protein JNM43_29500 [Planctomycetaceae bacterium]|nr:hypothetical protein [Planctomycetaceae bacterium]
MNMALVATINGLTSGAFLIARGPAGLLRLRTDDGSSRDVTLRAGGPLAAEIVLSTANVVAGPEDTLVEVSTSIASRFMNDATIELVVAGTVVVTIPFTSVAAPEIQFEGRFQCRLASDPDGFDHPWGVSSSFGLYAVQGPNPSSPYEPSLDRIIRFETAIALRPFCPVIGVSVKRVRGRLSDGTQMSFDVGDLILGVPVQLGPNCKFDAQDGAVAAPGFEPISDFQISVGAMFFGETDPSVARPDPSSPPPSKAPYADGFFRMDQFGSVAPSDLGYPEANWTDRATAITSQKLALLNAQVPTDAKEIAIRDRRILEHSSNLGGISFPLRMMERYSGTIDQNIQITPGDSLVMKAFMASTSFRFYGEFFDFDSDCQCGTVWGTITPI